MSDKMEGAITTAAALLVLFTAMLDPRVSIALGFLSLILYGTYKFVLASRR